MKTFIYKVYDPSGNYIGTWDDVVNEPEFSQEINSATSELVVQLARRADDFDEENSVNFNNTVKIYVNDLETNGPELLFQGKIVDYTPIFGTPEGVEVVLYTLGYELDNYIYRAPEASEQSQATGASEIDFGDTTTIAQSFIPDQPTLTSVDLKLRAEVPTDVTLTVKNNSGSEPGSSVANGSINKEITNTSMEVIKFTFSTPPTLVVGSTYWLVLTA